VLPVLFQCCSVEAGLNFTFQTNGQTKSPLLCLESWSKLPTTLYWLKALEGIWRREQTAAIVREIFRQ
jgi:hypothetical protein